MRIGKRLKRALAVTAVVTSLMFNTCMITASAMDLNSVGEAPTQAVTTQADTSKNGSAVDEGTFQILYGDTAISEEDATHAAKIAEPAVKLARTIMAVLLAVFPVIILLNSVIDIVCLTISPFRKAMIAAHGGGAGGASPMGGMGGMGMGGMSMGMGMGGMGGAPAGQPAGILQTIAQWTSKEAYDTAVETMGGAGGASPMGGMGGMSMGMGGMGMGGAAPAAPAKNVLVTYFKKRLVFLVAFGVCIIVFSCTAFTDLGLEVGAWIVEKVSGISF